MDAYYYECLKDGQYFEQYIYNVLEQLGICIVEPFLTKEEQVLGENSAGVEVKHDRLMKRYGNIYLELEERVTSPNWIPSGIFRNDNTIIYVIGDYDNFFLFQKGVLQWLVNDIITNEYFPIKEVKQNSNIAFSTSRGIPVPVDILRYRCMEEVRIELSQERLDAFNARTVAPALQKEDIIQVIQYPFMGNITPEEVQKIQEQRSMRSMVR